MFLSTELLQEQWSEIRRVFAFFPCIPSFKWVNGFESSRLLHANYYFLWRDERFLGIDGNHELNRHDPVYGIVEEMEWWWQYCFNRLFDCKGWIVVGSLWLKIIRYVYHKKEFYFILFLTWRRRFSIDWVNFMNLSWCF
jgi:hypothetical protein